MDVAVGRVVKVHGIRGELAVESHTDVPEQRFVVGAVLTARVSGGEPRRVTIVAARPHGSRFLLRFSELADRDAAETLRGALLLADTDDLTAIEDPDEFYDFQLEGLRAELLDGTSVGTVSDVVHAPAGELLAIERDQGTTLVPFVRQIVVEVNVDARRVVLDPPEGLLDVE